MLVILILVNAETYKTTKIFILRSKSILYLIFKVLQFFLAKFGSIEINLIVKIRASATTLKKNSCLALPRKRFKSKNK